LIATITKDEACEEACEKESSDMHTATKIAPKREGQETGEIRKGESMMRLFSYACKVKDVEKFFIRYKLVLNLALKQIYRERSVV